MLPDPLPPFLHSLLTFVLHWPSMDYLMGHYPWIWPMTETFHFIGLSLLVGIVGMFDLRMLGVVKGIPIATLRGLMPWSVFGAVLAICTGLMFVTGIGGNLYGKNPVDILVFDVFLQIKLLFIILAGVNVLAFYVTGASRAVDALGPEEDAPPVAKVIAGTSLALWLGVVYFGRLIPWMLP